MKWLVALLLVLVGNGLALAEDAHCSRSEASCVLEAAWSAALFLNDEKRGRLAPAFLELTLLADDAKLVSEWETRFGKAATPAPDYGDYGWDKAAPLLQAGGVDSLIRAARAKEAPLHFGRADALLSAGKRLLADDPNGAERLNQELLDLARGASAFEQPGLAHAAAELAMVRCDVSLLGTSVALTNTPDSPRYGFWRARISGNTLDLLPVIRAHQEEDDTRFVRQVLDGYRAILELGYCPG